MRGERLRGTISPLRSSATRLPASSSRVMSWAQLSGALELAALAVDRDGDHCYERKR